MGYQQPDYRDKELNFKGVIITHLDRMSKMLAAQELIEGDKTSIYEVYDRSISFLEDSMTPLQDDKYRKAVEGIDKNLDKTQQARAKYRELMNLMLRRGMLMERSRRLVIEKNGTE